MIDLIVLAVVLAGPLAFGFTVARMLRRQIGVVAHYALWVVSVLTIALWLWWCLRLTERTK